MKLSLLAFGLVFATPTFACFDPNATLLNNEQVHYYADHVGFAACLEKLAAEGVDMNHLNGARSERPAHETGPVIYTVMVQGNDSADHPVRIYIEYNLKKKNFTCEQPTRSIPRCF